MNQTSLIDYANSSSPTPPDPSSDPGLDTYWIPVIVGSVGGGIVLLILVCCCLCKLRCCKKYCGCCRKDQFHRMEPWLKRPFSKKFSSKHFLQHKNRRPKPDVISRRQLSLPNDYANPNETRGRNRREEPNHGGEDHVAVISNVETPQERAVMHPQPPLPESSRGSEDYSAPFDDHFAPGPTLLQLIGQLGGKKYKEKKKRRPRDGHPNDNLGLDNAVHPPTLSDLAAGGGDGDNNADYVNAEVTVDMPLYVNAPGISVPHPKPPLQSPSSHSPSSKSPTFQSPSSSSQSHPATSSSHQPQSFSNSSYQDFPFPSHSPPSHSFPSQPSPSHPPLSHSSPSHPPSDSDTNDEQELYENKEFLDQCQQKYGLPGSPKPGAMPYIDFKEALERTKRAEKANKAMEEGTGQYIEHEQAVNRSNDIQKPNKNKRQRKQHLT